jgi:hypothetical protein
MTESKEQTIAKLKAEIAGLDAELNAIHDWMGGEYQTLYHKMDSAEKLESKLTKELEKLEHENKVQADELKNLISQIEKVKGDNKDVPSRNTLYRKFDEAWARVDIIAPVRLDLKSKLRQLQDIDGNLAA